jgi:SAM-dependent methyltransferase
MTDTAREPDADRFDFYGAHYRRFGAASRPPCAVRRTARAMSARPAGARRRAGRHPGLLRLGPGAHVLDVACGAGGPSLDLAQRTGCRVTAWTSNRRRRPGRGGGRRAGPGRPGRLPRPRLRGRLPFADGAFDAVLCVDAVVHLPDRFARPCASGRACCARAAAPVRRRGRAHRPRSASRARRAGRERRLPAGPAGVQRGGGRGRRPGPVAPRGPHRDVAGIAGRCTPRARATPPSWSARRARTGSRNASASSVATAELAAGRRLSRFLYLAERPSRPRPKPPVA